MSGYDNAMRGSIWRNEKKAKDTDPDFTGAAEVAGVAYWVSAWRRKPDAGPNTPALKFSFKAKDAAKYEAKPAARDDLDGDVPF